MLHAFLASAPHEPQVFKAVSLGGIQQAGVWADPEISEVKSPFY
jgi:hypothetical protein